VIEFNVSTPIAFDDAARIELAFCVAVLVDSTTMSSAASGSVLSSISASRALALWMWFKPADVYTCEDR
jgi:hypothetical protein